MSARETEPGAGCRREKATRQVTGRIVLICFVAFFAVVAGVNAVMIRAAVSTFSGIETENPYQAGLAFEREILAEKTLLTRELSDVFAAKQVRALMAVGGRCRPRLRDQ